MSNRNQSTTTYKALTLTDIFKGNSQIHNPKADIAEHATSLLLGQGYSVDILRNDKIDEKLNKDWKKIERFNKFSKILEANEYDLSYDGFKIITVEKVKDNVLLTQNDNNFFSKVATFQQISEISAVIWKKTIIDNLSWAIKELWDNKRVVREWYLNNEKVILENLDVPIPDEFRLPKIWNHNLGILPLKLFLNKNRNITHLMEYYELSDTSTSDTKIKALNLFANQELKEAVVNTTKIFGTASSTQLKDLEKAYGNDAGAHLMLGQMLFNVSQGGENSPNKHVEILQGNPAFEKYILAQEDALRQIWRAAGYTYMTGQESTSSNAETLYANAFDIRTTKKKKTTRQADYSDLILKCLIVNKSITVEEWENGDIEVIFNIKENAVQTPNQITDNAIKLIEAGLISKARGLMEIQQLPNLEQAEEWVKEASEEMEAEAEAQYERMEKAGMTETGNDKMTASIEPKGVNE